VCVSFAKQVPIVRDTGWWPVCLLWPVSACVSRRRRRRKSSSSERKRRWWERDRRMGMDFVYFPIGPVKLWPIRCVLVLVPAIWGRMQLNSISRQSWAYACRRRVVVVSQFPLLVCSGTLPPAIGLKDCCPTPPAAGLGWGLNEVSKLGVSVCLCSSFVPPSNTQDLSNRRQRHCCWWMARLLRRLTHSRIGSAISYQQLGPTTARDTQEKWRLAAIAAAYQHRPPRRPSSSRMTTKGRNVHVLSAFSFSLSLSLPFSLSRLSRPNHEDLGIFMLFLHLLRDKRFHSIKYKVFLTFVCVCVCVCRTWGNLSINHSWLCFIFSFFPSLL
jgi:hypothetical protein